MQKWIRPAAMFVGLALVALPTAASIRAMDLSEYMEITVETLHGTIVAKETFRNDYPEAGTVWTRITVEGDAWRAEEPVTVEAVFMGSHDPADNFFMSEMPEFRDVRIGHEVVMFYGTDPSVHPDRGLANVVWNLSGVFRVERGYGEPVLVGKGEGFAFTENVKLSEAKSRVRAIHQLIESTKAAQPVDGK